jgi:hypothetical protein
VSWSKEDTADVNGRSFGFAQDDIHEKVLDPAFMQAALKIWNSKFNRRAEARRFVRSYLTLED